MSLFTNVHFDNHEQVIYCNDQDSSLKAIIAASHESEFRRRIS